jgi:hypothetical protein
MQLNRSPRDSDPASSRRDRDTPAEEDLKWQGRVLGLIIYEHPHYLSEHEIVRELVGEKPTFAEKDAVKRAIEEVVRAGLFRRCESLVLLTHAAKRMFELEFE